MRRALATIGVGPMEPVLAQALRTFRPYAGRFGYELHLGDGESAGRPTSWAKVLLLRRLLDEYAEVLWLDADVAILDSSVDLAAVVDGAAYQALAEWQMSGGHIGLNVGVWFLRADDRARAFLRAVWDSTAYVDHRWWENAAVIDLLGHSVDGSPRRAESPWLDGTSFLTQEWNTFVALHGLRPARFRHYAAEANERRERWIRADADKIEGNRAWIFRAARRWLDRHILRPPADLRIGVARRAQKLWRR